MKYTLLEMTQNILAAMDGDEVNSFDETAESAQVAQLIRQTYYDIITGKRIPEHYTLFQLEASGDPDLPVIMYKPDDVQTIEWLKYNKILDGDTAPDWQDVPFVPLDEFLRMTYLLNEDDDEVASLTLVMDNADEIELLYRNDKAPDVWTTFNDSTIIFDSYDSDVDSTLQRAKTTVYGQMIQTFTMDDDFVPNLDENLFSLLLNEAKVVCFADLKQAQNATAEKRSRKALIATQKQKRNVDSNRSFFSDLPNYGRRRP